MPTTTNNPHKHQIYHLLCSIEHLVGSRKKNLSSTWRLSSLFTLSHGQFHTRPLSVWSSSPPLSFHLSVCRQSVFFLYTRRVWNACMMWTKWKLNFISSMCWMLRALSLSLLLLLTIEWRWEKIISIINFLYAHFTPSCSNTLAAIVVRSPSCLSMMFFCFAHVYIFSLSLFSRYFSLARRPRPQQFNTNQQWKQRRKFYKLYLVCYYCCRLCSSTNLIVIVRRIKYYI